MTSDRRAGRPRDPRIEQAALGAARDLLVEGGWPALTVAAVAERAGTTKPALYRRWPSLPHLAYEAAFPDEVALDFTLTEDLHSDLAGIVTGIRTIFTSPIVAAALPGLLAEFSVHPHLHSSLLARFADQEGRTYLRRFYRQYRPTDGTPPRPLPDADAPPARHPLEQWLIEHLRQHPKATLAQVLAASTEQRQEAYAWLFRTRHAGKQDVVLLAGKGHEATQEIKGRKLSFLDADHAALALAARATMKGAH